MLSSGRPGNEAEKARTFVDSMPYAGMSGTTKIHVEGDG